jgi:hypothetical protein
MNKEKLERLMKDVAKMRGQLNFIELGLRSIIDEELSPEEKAALISRIEATQELPVWE